MRSTYGDPEPTRRATWRFEAAPGDIRWALRVASGASLAFWGFASLDPQASWFPNVIGLALLVSGAMLMTNKLVSLALTILVPVSFHLLMRGVLLGG